MKLTVTSSSRFIGGGVILCKYQRMDYALYFGRFSEEKGIGTLIKVCKELPDVQFIFAGVGPLEDTIKGVSNIKNVGFQKGEALEKLIREARFSIYPSEWYENCPFSVMESQMYGTPVLGADIGGIPELIQVGKTGELFESGNAEDLKKKIVKLSLHNSFYFVEAKNIIHDRPMVAKNFENLVNELLRSNSPKKWFRAYFNHGLINYIYGQKRLLPCDMSFDTFFIDPYGDVMPCNGTKDKEVMGNLNTQSWDELWNSPQAEEVRKKVRCCDRDCWMIGSVSPAMHKYIWKPATWVLVHKFKALFTKHPYSMYELKICRDYRDGKVTKEELDKCSTCDMCAVVNNGLSEASKEQLKHKTGEEIVDADIKNQMKFE